MRATIPIRKALEDPNLLGRALGGPSWRAWRVLLIAAMGEALTDDERPIFKQLTGRDREPLQRCDELVLVIGRKGGKSRAMATLATYLAGLCEHDCLVPGERGVVLCVAQSQIVAKIVLDFAEGCFTSSPLLKRLIANRTADSLVLTNGIVIEVRPASFRALRGPTYVAVIADEIAFWWTDSEAANPDTEIIGAIRPALGLTGGILVMASSTHAKRGVLYTQYQRHYGPQGNPSILVVHATTRDMNPLYPQARIDEALAEDYALNAAEYLSLFRTDIETFVAREVVEACVAHGTYGRDPRANLRYVAFTDLSGGSADSSALAISYRDGDLGFLACLREVRAPHSPESVCEEFSGVLKSYGISRVMGDRYASQWPIEAFKKFGITYAIADKTKSDIYLNALPLLNSRRVELLDNPRLVNQICSLERRTARGGRSSIDHPRNAHDDVANAALGALLLSTKPKQRARTFGTNGVDWCERDPETGVRIDQPAPSQVVRRPNGHLMLQLSPGANHCIPTPAIDHNGSRPTKGSY